MSKEKIEGQALRERAHQWVTEQALISTENDGVKGLSYFRIDAAEQAFIAGWTIALAAAPASLGTPSRVESAAIASARLDEAERALENMDRSDKVGRSCQRHRIDKLKQDASHNMTAETTFQSTGAVAAIDGEPQQLQKGGKEGDGERRESQRLRIEDAVDRVMQKFPDINFGSLAAREELEREIAALATPETSPLPCGNRFMAAGDKSLGIPRAECGDPCELQAGHKGQHSSRNGTVRWGDSQTQQLQTVRQPKEGQG